MITGLIDCKSENGGTVDLGIATTGETTLHLGTDQLKAVRPAQEMYDVSIFQKLNHRLS
jgi:hypothetical protein